MIACVKITNENTQNVSSKWRDKINFQKLILKKKKKLTSISVEYRGAISLYKEFIVLSSFER